MHNKNSINTVVIATNLITPTSEANAEAEKIAQNMRVKAKLEAEARDKELHNGLRGKLNVAACDLLPGSEDMNGCYVNGEFIGRRDD